MARDEFEQRAKGRSVAFNGVVVVGLWAVVAAGLLMARVGGVPTEIAGDGPAASRVADIATHAPSARTKDDAPAPRLAAADGPPVALPPIRPAGALANASTAPIARAGLRYASSSPADDGAVILAAVERFDACSPACESRDPFLVPASAVEPQTISFDTAPLATDDGFGIVEGTGAVVGAVLGSSRRAVEAGTGYVGAVFDGIE